MNDRGMRLDAHCPNCNTPLMLLFRAMGNRRKALVKLSTLWGSGKWEEVTLAEDPWARGIAAKGSDEQPQD